MQRGVEPGAEQRAAPAELPAVIASFFAHQTTDPQAAAGCFTQDAVVRDERRQHRGRAAIEAWNVEVVQKYGFEVEVLGAETSPPQTHVRVAVSGSFPGSPIELSYRFSLEGALISSLEIA